MGDPVPEALDWPENIRRANISMGYIKKVEEKKAAPAVSVSAKIAEKAPRPTPVSAAPSEKPAESDEDPLAAELGVDLPPQSKEPQKKKRR